MRFGTFHLIGAPAMQPGKQRIGETIDQMVLAEEIGLDKVWVAEHHFSNYGYATNPLLIIAKAAGLTKRIRFGQAVIVTPFWHPLRLAEDIALTDILTDGRLDVGLGRGYQKMETDAFELKLEESRALFLEQLAIMKKAWTEEDFTHAGRFFSVPRPITMLPKPLQKPHPRLYLACTQTDSFNVAAEKGIGVLSSATFATNILAEHVKNYRARVKQATPVGATINEFWGSNVASYCGEDDTEAKELGALSLKTFFGPDKPYIRDRVNAYEDLLESWGGVPDHLKADFGRWLRQSDADHQEHARQVGISLDSGPGAARAAFGEMDPDTLRERGIIIAGDPEHCIKGIQLYEDAGVDQVLLIMQTESIPHEKVLQSLELFGKHVIPAFRSRSSSSAPVAVGV
jgi:alkanesulfonate monooxygenase SsuD/methylene tetrahydromethanopterin reductase-like flavin-dependent oxidoreductase (luciferase family)